MVQVPSMHVELNQFGSGEIAQGQPLMTPRQTNRNQLAPTFDRNWIWHHTILLVRHRTADVPGL